jgi:ribosome maturation protein Sdo1
MDPISAIVGALVAGASAAATDVASKAVKDAYDGLKSLIATRFKRKAAVEMVEEAPESPAAREALSNALKEAKVDRDPDVAKKAEDLAMALKALGTEKLQRANIKIGDVDGYINAIVSGLKATGNVEVGNVIARSGDAIVSNVNAGDLPPKNR